MKKQLSILFVLFGLLLIGAECTTPTSTVPTAVKQTPKQAEQKDVITNTVMAVVEQETTSVTNTTVAEQEKILYTVSSVVDGDTIKVSINGEIETLRLIGIDTPETVDPRKVVQCFGKEASSKAKELLTGKKVYLEADPTQGERDKYGRLLMYVFLEDNRSYNKLMIEEGYAHEYTYNIPYKYQTEFKAAEKMAREDKKGLWNENTCNGDTTQAAEKTTTTAAPATTAPDISVSSPPPTTQTIIKEESPSAQTTVSAPVAEPTSATAPATSATNPQVKKSSTGICHEIGTTYYNRTINFTPYSSIQECLNSGGRLPLK